MAKTIKIKTAGMAVEAELNDSRTAKLVWEALPVKTKVETWGDEIYFTIHVASDLDETAKEFVEEGDIGYWPIGKAFCIFFGPTPITKGNKIKPASSVNIIGKVKEDPKVFKKAKDGDEIRIERED